MIDSGASHNFISQELLEKLTDVEVFDAARMEVQLANREQVMSSQVATLHILFAPTIEHTIEFRVVPKLNYPLILGMTWLSKHNPEIDWSKRVVSLSGVDLDLE